MSDYTDDTGRDVTEAAPAMVGASLDQVSQFVQRYPRSRWQDGAQAVLAHGRTAPAHDIDLLGREVEDQRRVLVDAEYGRVGGQFALKQRQPSLA